MRISIIHIEGKPFKAFLDYNRAVEERERLNILDKGYIEYSVMELSVEDASQQSVAADADIEFLLSLIVDWAKEVPKGLNPTMYGTLTYEGDLRVKNRLDKIIRRLKRTS